MPHQPSVDQIQVPGNEANEPTQTFTADIATDSGTIPPVTKASDSRLENKSAPVVSEDSLPRANEATPEDEDDIFAVDPSLSAGVHASHDAIVEMLHSDELPPAPQDHRSPSPLAPEAELQHDVALMMEPAPLLHRHDHHHNVVLEESHRIHEGKLLSFTSAMSAVDESASSLPRDGRASGNPQFSDTVEADSGELDQPVNTNPDNATTPPSSRVPIPPRLDLEQNHLRQEAEDHDDDHDPLLLSGRFDESESMNASNSLRTEVYVEVPIYARTQLQELSPNPDVFIEIQQRVRPTTPIHSSTSTIDPTRHHHGPVHRTSMSSIKTDDNDILGSPAAHTRSQCHYHKIRFGRGVFSHVLLIPHCSIGSEVARNRMGASDLGRVTKEEMLRKRDLNLGDTFTHKMSSDVETLPDDLEHHVRQLVGPELLREGHIWLLPMADVAPQSVITRSLEGADSLGDEDVFHVRSSPRLAARAPSRTPERKRKRGSSRARSTSTAQSEAESPESATMGTRSRSRATVVRKVSQIDEKEEEPPESTGGNGPQHSSDIVSDIPAELSTSFQDQSDATDLVGIKEDLAAKGEMSTPKPGDMDSDRAHSEKRSSIDDEDDNEDQDIDSHTSKKRIIEREDGEGRDAVDARPTVQKAGWLSWLFGKRS